MTWKFWTKRKPKTKSHWMYKWNDALIQNLHWKILNKLNNWTTSHSYEQTYVLSVQKHFKKTCLQGEKLSVSLILCLISFKIFTTMETLTCILVSSSSLLWLCTSSVDDSHPNRKLLSLVLCETKSFVSVVSVCWHE